MKARFLLGGMVFVVLLGGCGGNAATRAADEHDHTHAQGADEHDGHDSGMSALGEPGDPAEADQTIEVVASDSPFRFEPEEISVRAGDTVVFELVNEGAVEHELVLAEEPTRQATDGHEHAGQPNATKRAEPGQTEQLAWRFAEPGEYVYECHVDGHHLAGMRGTITVSE